MPCGDVAVGLQEWVLGLGDCARGSPSTLLRILWDVCYHDDDGNEDGGSGNGGDEREKEAAGSVPARSHTYRRP